MDLMQRMMCTKLNAWNNVDALCRKEAAFIKMRYTIHGIMISKCDIVKPRFFSFSYELFRRQSAV